MHLTTFYLAVFLLRLDKNTQRPLSGPHLLQVFSLCAQEMNVWSFSAQSTCHFLNFLPLQLLLTIWLTFFFLFPASFCSRTKAEKCVDCSNYPCAASFLIPDICHNRSLGSGQLSSFVTIISRTEQRRPGCCRI